jgi:hypothetical protein
MKKSITLFLIVFFSTATVAFMQNTSGSGSTSPENQDLVEKSVLAWADKTFEFYDGARFEKFEAAVSNDYMKLESKLQGMKEYKTELSDQYTSGSLNKTKEEYDKMIKKTDRKIDSLQTLVKNTPAGTSGFEVDFWANILTNNGLTVYYKHHIILNKDYTVTKHTVTSSVGKANDQQKILYKDKK